MSEEYPLQDIILPKLRTNQWGEWHTKANERMSLAKEHERVNEWEKDALLESLEEQEVKKPSLGFKELRNGLLIVLFVLFFCVPKIYLTNNIYYLSKDIINLQTQYDILLDENKRLKHELEGMRYEFLMGR
ncbi:MULTISPECIES: hypothetical protein [Helicobacter]|uniref:Membrane protein n=2 Tax=Helicobacter typhlonius TaxID=76936 RepID=A0A0S4PWT4_9HELI|nr:MULTISPECIES: hypothetical protein [Helicobacter]TLD78772.1 hypothetical protein LS75_003185 [Helicobacter typhlonius]TLD90107.1 hypothetical protein LS67_000110 [Helicobacter sp. MIT 03-1616]CUU40760.1 membrane protein [Helicobacter typhlonius]